LSMLERREETALQVLDILARCTRIRTIGVDAIGAVHRFRGAATSTRDRLDRLIVEETGCTLLHTGRKLASSNVYRWSSDPDRASLRLEHLRFGVDRPVELVEMFPGSSRHARALSFASREPHMCGPDRYHALLAIRSSLVVLAWRIETPANQARIRSIYAPVPS